MQPLETLSSTLYFTNELIEDYCKEKEIVIVERVILALYRKLVELSDGVYISADHELEAPALVSYRGAMEAYLALKYILLEPELLEKRAMAYYVGYCYQQIDVGEKGLRDYEKTPEQYGEEITIFKGKIEEIKKLLKEDIFVPVVQEWKKAKRNINKRKKSNHINPKWHSLFKGPMTINQLALYVQKKENEEEEYLMADLYSLISISAHNYLALSAFFNEDDKLLLAPVRFSGLNNEKDFNVITTRALLLSGTLSFVKVMYPEYEGKFEEFKEQIKPHISYT